MRWRRSCRIGLHPECICLPGLRLWNFSQPFLRLFCGILRVPGAVFRLAATDSAASAILPERSGNRRFQIDCKRNLSMKMSQIVAPALLTASIMVAGCYAPQPTTLFRTNKLPDKHWYELSESDSRIEALPAALRNSITQQRQMVETETAGGGAISPETSKKVADLDETCNGAYLISFDSIASGPTPEMNGQLESWDRRRQGDSMIFNQNLNALADEWSRFWLMEMPSSTPYDTVNTTGRF